MATLVIRMACSCWNQNHTQSSIDTYTGMQNFTDLCLKVTRWTSANHSETQALLGPKCALLRNTKTTSLPWNQWHRCRDNPLKSLEAASTYSKCKQDCTLQITIWMVSTGTCICGYQSLSPSMWISKSIHRSISIPWIKPINLKEIETHHWCSPSRTSGSSASPGHLMDPQYAEGEGTPGDAQVLTNHWTIGVTTLISWL